jgi:hypothetical protein
METTTAIESILRFPKDETLADYRKIVDDCFHLRLMRGKNYYNSTTVTRRGFTNSDPTP